MYFDQFLARLSKEPLPPAILLFGDAEGVLMEGAQAVREAFLKSKPQGTLSSFNGKEDTFSDVLAAAQTSGLFSADQLIFVQHARELLGGHPKSSPEQWENSLEGLKGYFAHPNPGSRLLLVAPGLKKTVKVVALLEEEGWAVQCSEVPEWKLGEWVGNQARKMNLQIPGEGIQVLIQKTGPDLAYLKGALAQLALYVYPRTSVTLEEVQSLPVPGGETEIFAFLDAVGLRKTEKAVRLLEGLGGGSEGGLLPMLYQRIRELWTVRLAQQRGLEPETVAKELGLHPFRVKNLLEQAAQFQAVELKGALEDLIHIQMGQVMGRMGKDAVAAAVEWWLLKWGKNRLSAVR